MMFLTDVIELQASIRWLKEEGFGLTVLHWSLWESSAAVVLEQQPTVGGEKCFEAKTAKFQASLKKNMTTNHAVLTHPPFLMCDSRVQVNKGAVTF